MMTRWADTRCSVAVSITSRATTLDILKPTLMLKSASFSALAVLERAFIRKQPVLAGIRNFLLLQYQLALGTAIHATPLLAALRAVLPEANIAAAASGFALEVLRGNPNLDRLVATPSPLTDMRGAVRALRAARFFDGKPYAALQTTGNERARIALAAMRSGGHTRIGFTVVPQLSAAPLIYDPQRSQIANNLRLIERWTRQDTGTTSKGDPRSVGASRLSLAAGRRNRALPASRATHRRSATHRSLRHADQPHAAKSWHADRFRTVAEWLDRDYGMQIVFVGSARRALPSSVCRRACPSTQPILQDEPACWNSPRCLASQTSRSRWTLDRCILPALFGCLWSSSHRVVAGDRVAAPRQSPRTHPQEG